MNKMSMDLQRLCLIGLTAAGLGACGEDVPIEGSFDLGTAQAGTIDPRVEGSVVSVEVPAGAESMALTVQGLGNNLLIAEKITAPSGKVVFDFFEDVEDNLTKTTDDIYTVIVPNNPDVAFESGQWQVQFLSDSSTPLDINVQGFLKSTPAQEKTLDINLFFVGEVEGLTAESARSDEDFQGVLSGFEEVYGQAGISLGTTNFFDITGSDAERFNELDFDDAGDLVALSGGFELTPESLNFFFVADLTDGNSGFTQLGVSPGVPGPPGVHGTSKSGVVVNLLGFREDPRDAVSIMAHEGGHFFGLYHTTEKNGTGLDPDGLTGSDHLSDTEVCPDSADENDDKILSASECESFDGGNIMFTAPSQDSPRTLTAKQGQVLVKNPIVK
jgi:hypothetical protein